MGIGKMTKLTVMEFIRIWMAPGTRDTGRKISSMARGSRLGLMEPPMKEITLRARSTELAASPGLTKASTTVNSKKTTSKAKESMNGAMAVSTKATGRTIKWKASASSRGLTADATKENT